MPINDKVTEKIIGCCFDVHNKLGPGFNEKIYHKALEASIGKAGLRYQSEKTFEIMFDDKKAGIFRVDMFIEDRIILEIKAMVGNMPKLFESQLISYLKASDIKVGFLVNFGNRSCQFKRLVNKL